MTQQEKNGLTILHLLSPCSQSTLCIMHASKPRSFDLCVHASVPPFSCSGCFSSLPPEECPAPSHQVATRGTKARVLWGTVGSMGGLQGILGMIWSFALAVFQHRALEFGVTIKQIREATNVTAFFCFLIHFGRELFLSSGH